MPKESYACRQHCRVEIGGVAMPATASQKIITTLRDRRQIEADVRCLIACGSELELRRQAELIAAHGEQVIPIIISFLNETDNRMPGALGVLASLLDRDRIVLALRQAVLQPGRTDRGRMAAITILERFLGERAGEELLNSLSDPRAAALASLDEVLTQADTNRAILIGYVQGLDRQQPDVVLAVVRALCQVGDQRAVEPLRMIAQDVRVEIAAAALQALGGLRLPAAAGALQTLIPITAPELVSTAQRMLRKLQFSGVPVSPLPLPDTSCWALVSPVDGLGQQMVWFMRGAARPGHLRFLTVLLSDRVGAIDAAGQDSVSARALPPRGWPGDLHEVPARGSTSRLLMMETSFDFGRRLVRDSLAYNWATQVPLAAPLRLLHPWLWDLGGVDALPAQCLPQPGLVGFSPADAEQLLRHPAFSSWTVDQEAMVQAAEFIVAHPGPGLDTWVRRLAGELFSGVEVVQVFSRRLTSMSEWLQCTGDEREAQAALAAAQSLAGTPPGEHPLVRAWVARDLQLALASLGRQAPLSQS